MTKNMHMQKNVYVLHITSSPNQTHYLARHRMCHECTLHCKVAK